MVKYKGSFNNKFDKVKKTYAYKAFSNFFYYNNPIKISFKKIFFYLLLFLIIIHFTIFSFSYSERFKGCYIASESGLLRDFDCDKIPDVEDNCPIVPNPDQLDQNNNSLGDACDLVITKITAEPPFIPQGRSLLVTTSLANFREYDMNLLIITSIKELGLSNSERTTIKMLEEKDVENYLTIPPCVTPGDYNLIINVTHILRPGFTESFSKKIKIKILPGVCYSNNEDELSMEVFELKNLGENNVSFPFILKNPSSKTKTIYLSVKNLDWADYQFEPNNYIVIPPKKSIEGKLKLWVNNNLLLSGKKSFLLIASSNDKTEEITLSVIFPKKNLEKNRDKVNNSFYSTFFLIFFISIIIGFLFLIIFLFIKHFFIKKNIGKKEKNFIKKNSLRKPVDETVSSIEKSILVQKLINNPKIKLDFNKRNLNLNKKNNKNIFNKVKKSNSLESNLKGNSKLKKENNIRKPYSLNKILLSVSKSVSKKNSSKKKNNNKKSIKKKKSTLNSKKNLQNKKKKKTKRK